MEHEAPPPPENETTEELTLSEIKPDPGNAAAPSEDMYEGGDVADAAPGEDLYDGGENNDNMEPEAKDDYQGEGGADPAPEEQQPVAVAGPSDGTPTDHLSVDDLMKSKVQECEGGFLCLICWKSMKYSGNMRVHLREKHIVSLVNYHCPPCDKIFNSKRKMKAHVDYKHKNWRGVNIETFAV